jgi:NitT/TauT family transport system substrate-binding protein
MNKIRLHLLPIALVVLLSGCGAPSNQHRQISFDDALAKVRQKIPADSYISNEFLKQVATVKPTPPSSPDHVRIGMPWILNDESALWYIAVEKGFFRDMGIEAELVPGGPGKDPLALMIGNSLDIAVVPGGASVVSLIASPTGAKVTAICTLLKDSQYSWLTLDHTVGNDQASHKELKPEDLIGKKIGVQSDGQRYVDFVIQRFKLPADQIKVVQVGFSIDPLVSGAVDFYAGWFQNQPRFLEQQGYKNWLALRFRDLGWTEEGDVSVVMKTLAEKNPGLVARYVYALSQAVQVYLNQPEEAADITLKDSKDANLTRDMVLRRFELEKDLVLGKDGQPPLWMSVESWNNLAALLTQYGGIELP